jgi:AraC-like DNA-binding protein
MKIYIKNMVCDRCKMVVRSVLEKLELGVVSVELGEVILSAAPNDKQKSDLDTALQEYGFALIDNKKARTIEKIKALIVELVHQQNAKLDTNLSDFLSHRIASDYGALSRLFSEVEGLTIEKYFIAQKIERVKELLVYDELSLSEIADLLHYSSVAYLSGQFKKITGFTPSHFKTIRENKRRPLDAIQKP